MALGNSVNKIFLSVADGRIVQRVKDSTPGAIPRAKKDGTIVYELKYAYITGILTGISVRTSQYQGSEMKEWQFDLTDGQENYQVQMMYDSRYATSLLFALANPAVDFGQPITITPWMKVVDDKKKTSCYLKQGETPIDWHFTRDNPNGLPELELVKFQGRERWDSYNRMVFLEKYINDNVKPKLKGAAASSLHAPAVHDTQSLPARTYDDLPEEDDLPF